MEVVCVDAPVVVDITLVVVVPKSEVVLVIVEVAVGMITVEVESNDEIKSGEVVSLSSVAFALASSS